jgi:glycosyltransferase involved in cell wall biosynthesis
MNVPFCLWLWMRASIHGDEVDLMVHEAYLAFGEGSWRQNVVAAVHRVMTVILLRAARRVQVSIPTWEDHLRPYRLGSGATFRWLPVPSTIPVSVQPEETAATRQAYLCGWRFLVGHFGIFSEMGARLLKEIVPPLLDRVPKAVVLFIGKDSEKHRDALIALAPHHRPRIHATGVLGAAALSHHLAACDLAIQPYPDGLSSRRTSAMAAIAHGLPLVTTTGRLTEPLWLESGAVAAVPAGNAGEFVEAACRLLADEAGRARLGERARDLYDSRFDVRHSIAALRSETT